MTSEQIRALNTMACSNPTNRFEFIFDGVLVTLSVMSYDHTTNEGHWNLSYPSYTIDLYSQSDLLSYDRGVLRSMYTEYYNRLLAI